MWTRALTGLNTCDSSLRCARPVSDRAYSSIHPLIARVHTRSRKPYGFRYEIQAELLQELQPGEDQTDRCGRLSDPEGEHPTEEFDFGFSGFGSRDLKALIDCGESGVHVGLERGKACFGSGLRRRQSGIKSAELSVHLSLKCGESGVLSTELSVHLGLECSESGVLSTELSVDLGIECGEFLANDRANVPSNVVFRSLDSLSHGTCLRFGNAARFEDLEDL